MNVKPGIITSRVQTGVLPGRWSGVYANPIGRIDKPTRTARNLHPKLNTSPWSTSFAVKRKSLPHKASKNVGMM